MFYFFISIFLFLVFNLNFFSIGCAVNHHRQLFNVQRYGSPGRHQTPVDALPIGEDFLQQTSAIRDWVFYKNSLPIVWLTALYFNSIKVRLEQGFLFHKTIAFKFQFHKGAIRTFLNLFLTHAFYISIP